MTPLLTGLLWSQKMMMKPFYQGGLSEVAFLSGCQSVACGHGLWNQLHVYMGCRTEKGFSLTPPFPKVEKPRPGSGQCAHREAQGMESAAPTKARAPWG